jgi:hypothetical protein
MSKFKVFGDKLVEYYIDVEANSAEEAWDIASNAATHNWIQLERDSVIQVHFVDNELEEDTTDLLEDGYPSMSNDIIVVDKSDISD